MFQNKYDKIPTFVGPETYRHLLTSILTGTQSLTTYIGLFEAKNDNVDVKLWVDYIKGEIQRHTKFLNSFDQIYRKHKLDPENIALILNYLSELLQKVFALSKIVSVTNHENLHKTLTMYEKTIKSLIETIVDKEILTKSDTDNKSAPKKLNRFKSIRENSLNSKILENFLISKKMLTDYFYSYPVKGSDFVLTDWVLSLNQSLSQHTKVLSTLEQPYSNNNLDLVQREYFVILTKIVDLLKLTHTESLPELRKNLVIYQDHLSKLTKVTKNENEEIKEMITEQRAPILDSFPKIKLNKKINLNKESETPLTDFVEKQALIEKKLLNKKINLNKESETPLTDFVEKQALIEKKLLNKKINLNK